jgi:hypothetical protein
MARNFNEAAVLDDKEVGVFLYHVYGQHKCQIWNGERIVDLEGTISIDAWPCVKLTAAK